MDMKILLVEDSPEARELIAGMLNDLEVAEIVTAEDGAEALALFESVGDGRPFDAVLCDWHMPRMDGIEVLQRIREIDPAMPFVMLTGSIDGITAEACGAANRITKPFTVDALGKKLAPLSRLAAHRRRQKGGPGSP
jgi:CheY-like chemotaxis protein